MADKQNEIPLSKKNQREVSSFVGHELLYDYICGNLDPERRKAVEEHLKYSRDAQLDLTKIQYGQNYADTLSKTVVSEAVVEQINSPSTYMTVLMQKSQFEKWPVGLKWGLEALGVISVVVILLTVAPWEKLMRLSSSDSSEVILAEVTKENPTSDEKQVESDTQKFADETVAPSAPTSAVNEQSAKPTVAAPPVVAPVATAPVKPTPAPTPSKPAPTATVAETAPVVEPAKASGGFLYRGQISITNIEMAGPKITEKITALGGRKAGDVELGWKKTPTSLYYHFTIPEAKYQELQTFLASYGAARISKEKHPRVMPDGIIRLIIAVDEK